MKARFTIAAVLLGVACSSEPVFVALPDVQGQSTLIITRSQNSIQYVAAHDNADTAIVFSEGQAQLLSFAGDLQTIGLTAGAVQPSTEPPNAPLPEPLEVFTFDAAERGWAQDQMPWDEATAFRVFPNDLCPNFEEEVMRPDIRSAVKDALQRPDGSLLIVSTATVTGEGGVHEVRRGEALVHLQRDDEDRQVIAQSGDSVWIGGSKLWRDGPSPGWNPEVVATSADLENSPVRGVAGPVELAGELYEIVAHTREGVFWGWTGSELLRLADGYPTEAKSAAIKAEQGLYFTRSFASGSRRQNVLIRLGPQGIESLDVPESISDSTFRTSRIHWLLEADGILFLASARLGKLLSFEQGSFRSLSPKLDISQRALVMRGRNLIVSDSRKDLRSRRDVNGVQLECPERLSRAGADGSTTYAGLFPTSSGLVWVVQSTENSGAPDTQVRWLDEGP